MQDSLNHTAAQEQQFISAASLDSADSTSSMATVAGIYLNEINGDK